MVTRPPHSVWTKVDYLFALPKLLFAVGVMLICLLQYCGVVQL